MKPGTKKSGRTLNIYKTENDIPQQLRLKLNVLANQGLADAVDLQILRGERPCLPPPTHPARGLYDVPQRR